MKKLLFVVSLLALMSSCGSKTNEKQTAMITKKVGDFNVILLSDTEFTPSRSILLGLTPEIQEKYAPDSTLKLAVNSFLIKTPTQNILVDAGIGAKIEENLKEANVQPTEITTILITHAHGDHVLGLVKNDTALFPNAKIYISAADTAFIQDDEFINSLPEESRAGFILVRKALQVYTKQIEAFTPNELDEAQKKPLIEGIFPIAAYGHTPGHTAYLLDSGQDRLLIWGDLVHYMPVQMPHPEISLVYDKDPEMAKQSRIKLLNYAASNQITIAGMHLSPSMGTIASNSNGGYEFTPITK